MRTSNIVFLVLSLAGPAVADDTPEASAFEQSWALGAYVSGWEGPYGAVGAGGRLRWEASSLLGIEVFAETAAVETWARMRRDYQVGFNLFMPWWLSDSFRLRGLLGFCAVVSVVEPEEAHAPSSQDILFGPHAGLGIEWSLSSWISLFLDAQAVLYLGHETQAGDWSATVGDELITAVSGQGQVGVQIHFGGP